jgi:serine/threonine protein kinase
MSEPSKARTCPQCGAAIPENAPRGLCPKCLLEGAAATTATYTDTGQRPEPPSLEALKAAFPHLEVLEFIGQGGMGFVFKARQPKLERFVALKLLPESLSRDAAFAERSAREGRLLARLNHPNVVSVYDFGQANAVFYLLMEFVDGVNLRQAMRASRFTPEQALAIVPSICAALQYAHDEGVLHRDIKPENILLDTKGRVKIADFGIAKLLGEAKAGVGLTTSGAALGTPHYMAPEQIEKPSDVDHRADIYSLGVVFYELLTDELPLGRFAPPSAKTPVNAQVDEVVMRALEKERERRQQSAGEMKTQVETAAASPAGLGERPIEQTPQLSRITPWPKRLFWLIVALVVVPVLMIVSGLLLLWPAYRSVQSPSASSTSAAPLQDKTIVLTGATNHRKHSEPNLFR